MLEQIRYFQSVVRNNSFSEAAEENYISQSAVSQQVRALERELGFLLLERKNRRFTLTPAGEYFYQKSLLLVSDLDRICAEAARIADGNEHSLHIGFLRSYTGCEFHMALEQFSEKYPDVSVTVEYGNHEELYELMRTGAADIIMNDQRRAFSDEYVNRVLARCESFIEVSSHSPLAQMKSITPEELKNVPCILVSSASQQEAEGEYYRTDVGFYGGFVFAENLEAARMLVIGKKGFMPVEGGKSPADMPVSRVPLVRGNEPVMKNICSFRRKDRGGYAEIFENILAQQFI